MLRFAPNRRHNNQTATDTLSSTLIVAAIANSNRNFCALNEATTALTEKLEVRGRPLWNINPVPGQRVAESINMSLARHFRGL
jgi:hypothetical protein